MQEFFDKIKSIMKAFERALDSFISSLQDWWKSIWDKEDRTNIGKKCKVLQLTKKQEYSRGNNDLRQIKAQFAATGKYQYETNKFFLDIVTNNNCMCSAGGKCTGVIDINATLKIISVTQPAADLSSYVLLCGPTSSVITEEYNKGIKPKPDVKISVDNVALPSVKIKNKFKNTVTKPQEWIATATCNTPCSVGKYQRRFYLVHKSNAATTFDTSQGLLFFIDCVMEITQPRPCELSLDIKAFLLEYRPGFDFTSGDSALIPGLKELPEVTHTHPTGGTTTKTRSITKLIKEDGTTIDTPFPSRDSSVPP